VINGGSHAGNKLAFQEYFVIPTGAQTFSEGMLIGTEVRRDRAEIAPRLCRDRAEIAPRSRRDYAEVRRDHADIMPRCAEIAPRSRRDRTEIKSRCDLSEMALMSSG